MGKVLARNTTFNPVDEEGYATGEAVTLPKGTPESEIDEDVLEGAGDHIWVEEDEDEDDEFVSDPSSTTGGYIGREQPSDTPEGEGVDEDELGKLKKDELEQLAADRGYEVPSGATKAEIIEILSDAAE